MITSKREGMAERVTDAADAVKDAWTGARERGADAVETAKSTISNVRNKVGDAQDTLADQLEAAAEALRRSARNPVSRMARERPVSTVVLAFAAGVVAATLAGVLINATNND